jgi:hypothetical protein
MSDELGDRLEALLVKCEAQIDRAERTVNEAIAADNVRFAEMDRRIAAIEQRMMREDDVRAPGRARSDHTDRDLGKAVNYLNRAGE